MPIGQTNTFQILTFSKFQHVYEIFNFYRTVKKKYMWPYFRLGVLQTYIELCEIRGVSFVSGSANVLWNDKIILLTLEGN
jgi:hypothetical protein